MGSDQPDAFCEFARSRGLEFSAADINAAPRDVTASADELEWHRLVSLSCRTSDRPIQLVFTTDQLDTRPLSIRDVLWWLSSDSWAVERARRDLARWAELYHQSTDSIGASRLFQVHVRQADALRDLLGEADYRVLLSLYQAELTAR